MRAILIYLFLLGPLPAILMRPHVGVLMWALVSYMNPHRLTFGSAFSFPFLDIIAPLTLAGWMFSNEPKKMPSHTLVWLIAGFFAYTSLTAYLGTQPSISYDKWLIFLKIIFFSFVTIALINNRIRLMSLIWVSVLSLGYFGIKGGLFTVLKGGTSIVWGPAGSFIEDNNALALAMVMLIPLIRFLHMQTKNKYLRWALFASILLVLLSVFGSQSRGAFLALSAMLVFFVIISKHKALGFGMIGLALFAGLIFMPDRWTTRMETIGTFQSDSSAMGRVEMWKFADRVADDYPLGAGFDVFYNLDLRARYLGSANEGRAVHSIYFELLGEHGYFGLFLFLVIAATGFFTAQRIKVQSRASPDMQWAGELASMCQISMIGYAVAGAFLNLSTFDFYWQILAIIVITDLLLQRELNETATIAPAATGSGPLVGTGRTSSPKTSSPNRKGGRLHGQ